MIVTKLEPRPCRWLVDGGWREGGLIAFTTYPGSGWYYIVRDRHSGECFELNVAPEMITEPHEETA
jgi:hypothetical protein